MTTLELNFRNEKGKNSKMTLDNPRSNLSADEVRNVMEDIIAVNIFTTSGGDFKEVDSAKVITKDVIELF